MTRYFFDVRERDVHTADDTGTELELAAVPREARRLLLDLTKDLHITDDRYGVEVTVREGGRTIHWSSLLLERGWLAVDPAK